jgi:hypothetical protein
MNSARSASDENRLSGVLVLSEGMVRVDRHCATHRDGARISKPRAAGLFLLWRGAFWRDGIGHTEYRSEDFENDAAVENPKKISD